MTVMKNILLKKLFKMLMKLEVIAEARENKTSTIYQSDDNNSEGLKEWTRGYKQALEDVSNAVHYDTYPRVIILDKDGEE